MQPKSMQSMDAGDPSKGGAFRQQPDRELPIPSPSANLVGIWKGTTADKGRRQLPAAFHSPLSALHHSSAGGKT